MISFIFLKEGGSSYLERKDWKPMQGEAESSFHRESCWPWIALPKMPYFRKKYLPVSIGLLSLSVCLSLPGSLMN